MNPFSPTYRRSRTLHRLLTVAATFGAAFSLPARTLIELSDAHASEWRLFVPSKYADCGASFQIDSGIALMKSDELARFALQSSLAAVEPGQPCHYKARILITPQSELERKSPGVVLRLTYYNADKKPLDSEHLHIGIGGETATVAAIGNLNRKSWPGGWTDLEGDFEAPANAHYVQVALFIWTGKGPVAWHAVEVTAQ
ncbi:MAG: hypothetical protein Q7P63_17155 [Verrucomicrobiota bacterium JB022]|nr:hypothetical protein [Verrucomicrobiota bacterium JB022]